MKYVYIFGFAALSLAIGACDKIEDPEGLPQTNPQLPIVQVEDLDVTVNSATAIAIDIPTANDLAPSVPLCTINTPADFPEGFSAQVLYVEVGNDADFTKSTKVACKTDAEGYVTFQADDLQAAQLELFGKDPATTTTYFRIPAWAVNGSQQIRLGSATTYWSTFSTQVSPLNLFNGHVIEDAYYLIGSFNNWDFSTAVKMSHSDYNPYDDPVFTVSMPEVAGGYTWIVIPESTYAAGDWVSAPESSYGVTNDDEANGTLVPANTASYGTPGKIDYSYPAIIKIDMEKLAYTSAPTVMFTPGDANGWNSAMSQTLSSTDISAYTGVAYLKSEYKFALGATEYGAAANGGMLAEGGQSLTVDTPGLYWINVNMTGLSYTASLVDHIYLVGDGCAAGWGDTSDKSIALTPSADYLVWTVTADLTDGVVKFRVDDKWNVSFGGTPDDITFNGGNITSPGTGKYLITLDFSGRPYTATFTAQ